MLFFVGVLTTRLLCCRLVPQALGAIVENMFVFTPYWIRTFFPKTRFRDSLENDRNKSDKNYLFFYIVSTTHSAHTHTCHHPIVDGLAKLPPTLTAGMLIWQATWITKLFYIVQ